MKTTNNVRDTIGSPNSSSGSSGSAVRRSTITNTVSRTAAAASHGTTRVGHIAECNQQCGDAAKEQGRAGPVDPCRCRRRTRRIGGGDDDRGQDAEREVQIEHPSPRQRVGDVATDERSGNRRHAPHAAEQRLRAGALIECVEFADDRHAQRDDSAGAEPLEGAEGDQLRHAGRRPGQGGAGQEHQNARRGTGDAGRTSRRGGPKSAPTPSMSAVGREHPAVMGQTAAAWRSPSASPCRRPSLQARQAPSRAAGRR